MYCQNMPLYWELTFSFLPSYIVRKTLGYIFFSCLICHWHILPHVSWLFWKASSQEHLTSVQRKFLKSEFKLCSFSFLFQFLFVNCSDVSGFNTLWEYLLFLFHLFIFLKNLIQISFNNIKEMFSSLKACNFSFVIYSLMRH